MEEMEKLFKEPIRSPSGQPVQLCNHEELLRIKVEAYNSIDCEARGYDCPLCRNRESIAFLRDDGTIAFKDCRCKSIRKYLRKIEKSGMKDTLQRFTFETFNAEEPWQQTIKEGAKRFSLDPKGWLLFCGQSGSGKTHLCTAVCNALLLAGNDVTYMPWRDDVSEIKSRSIDGDKRNRYISDLKKAPVLYIDDLFKAGRSRDGSCQLSSSDVGITFDIINYRYSNRLTTIISTELTPFDLAQIDEAVGGRIIEMAGQYTFAITPKAGRNYRLRNVVEV